MGEVVVVIDCSGSIEYDALTEFWGMIKEMWSDVSPQRLRLMAVNHNLQSNEIFECGDELPDVLDIRAGGGTNFRPAFDWLDDNAEEPAVLLYFTDMECDKFPTEPNYPVLWLDWGSDDYYKSDPPFGDKLDIV